MQQETDTSSSSSNKRWLGLVLLWSAILIYAASASVVAKLVLLGDAHQVDGRNPISFCNVLAVGNFVAAITLFVLHRRDWRPETLRQITRRQWCVQLGLAVTSGALAPALMFTALSMIPVTSVVLLETVEIPLGLFLAWLFYRQKSSPIAMVGAGLALLGVVVMLILKTSEPGMEMAGMSKAPESAGIGEGMVILAVFLFVAGSVISQRQIQTIPIGIFSVVRNAVGTVIFVILVFVLFGPEHFLDIFHPYLWGWMLVYGGLIVVCGQLCWFSGIREVKAADIALASSFSPVAGVGFAYLILGEVPQSAQIIGGVIILAGIGIGLAGPSMLRRWVASPDKAKAFTGV